jgi:uncharacterized protein YtpQ (UPF0354 family)
MKFLDGITSFFRGGDSGRLTPGNFTEQVIRVIGERAPEVKVEVLRPLQLKLRTPAGASHDMFLDNAFTQAQKAPDSCRLVIRNYVISALEVFQAADKPIDRERIVPVIKDRAYVEEVRTAMRERNPTADGPELVYEEYNEQLLILYAEDSSQNIRYLTPANLQELGLDMPGLRTLAIRNLPDAVPPVKVEEANGVCMIIAGGDYEASLILWDELWEGGRLPIEGEIVVAIPSRDLLLATSRGNAHAVALMRQLAQKVASEAAYRLTPLLFVRRSGRFEALSET